MDFNSILIGSAEPKRLVDFYTKVLGEPAYSDESYTGWQIGSGSINVGPHSEDIRPARIELVPGRVEGSLLDVGQDDLHAFGGPAVGQCPADAAGRAGDDRDLPLEVVHAAPSSGSGTT